MPTFKKVEKAAPVKKTAVKKAVKAALNETQMKDIALKALAYKAENDKLLADKKVVEKKKGELKNFLSEHAITAPNGHQVFEVVYADKKIILQNTKKNGTQQTPEALAILKKKFPKVVEKVEIIRNDKLEALILAGEIPDDVLSKCFTPVTTYAFGVKIAGVTDTTTDIADEDES